MVDQVFNNKNVRFFPDKVIWVGLGSKVVFWAVFNIFLLIILEAHVSQTHFPDSIHLLNIVIRNSGKAISYTVGFRQSKTALFDWILLVLLLIVSRVDLIVFVLFLEAVGVREYCCTAVEIGRQLCASRVLREQRLYEPSPQRVGGFGLSRKPPKLLSFVELHSDESRQSYSRRSRCWRHGINTARCCRRVIHAAGERN